MCKAFAGKPQVCNAYDAFSRRAYIWDPKNLDRDYEKAQIYIGTDIAYDPAETRYNYPTCYVYADGLLICKLAYKPSLERSFIHLDHLGSVRIITDASGNVIASFRYEPYGATWQYTGSSATKYLGRVYDDTSGLYCLGVRSYLPMVGRFLQEDPVLGDLVVPLTLNLYAYCAGDPINRADPQGTFFNLIAAGIGALTGAIIGGVIALATGEDVLTAMAEGAILGLTAGFTCGASLIASVGAKIVSLGSKVLGLASKVGKSIVSIVKSVATKGKDLLMRAGNAVKSLLGKAGEAAKGFGKSIENLRTHLGRSFNRMLGSGEGTGALWAERGFDMTNKAMSSARAFFSSDTQGGEFIGYLAGSCDWNLVLRVVGTAAMEKVVQSSIEMALERFVKRPSEVPYYAM